MFFIPSCLLEGSLFEVASFEVDPFRQWRLSLDAESFEVSRFKAAPSRLAPVGSFEPTFLDVACLEAAIFEVAFFQAVRLIRG